MQVVDWCRDAGMFYITFNGGEPLIRRDFWQIADYVETIQMHWRLFTNATLIREAEAKRLSRYEYLLNVQVSLDGISPRSYLSIRGGSTKDFERVVEAIKMLRREGVNVEISCVVHKGNVQELPKIIEFAASLECPLSIDHILPLGRGLEMWKNGEAILLSREELEKLNEIAAKVGLPTSIKSVKRGRPHIKGYYCRGADSYIRVSPKGEVAPCNFAFLPEFANDYPPAYNK